MERLMGNKAYGVLLSAFSKASSLLHLRRVLRLVLAGRLLKFKQRLAWEVVGLAGRG